MSKEERKMIEFLEKAIPVVIAEDLELLKRLAKT